MNQFIQKHEYSTQIVCVEYLEKGKCRISLDNGCTFVLYKNELRQLDLFEGMELKDSVYQYILKDVIGKRARKRALHLLEKMDRTEAQLREKLAHSEYPEECIEDAIFYVKSFHYLDDYRYACNYIRYKQSSLSRWQLTQRLLMKGIGRDCINQALEEEYLEEEVIQIRQILQKKQFQGAERNTSEYRRMYQYLLRRGFKNSDIMKEMSLTQYMVGNCCNNSI